VESRKEWRITSVESRGMWWYVSCFNIRYKVVPESINLRIIEELGRISDLFSCECRSRLCNMNLMFLERPKSIDNLFDIFICQMPALQIPAVHNDTTCSHATYIQYVCSLRRCCWSCCPTIGVVCMYVDTLQAFKWLLLAARD